MKSSRLVASLLLFGEVQVGAQKADTTTHRDASPATGNSAGPVRPDRPDDSDPMPRCWLGCRHSLQRSSLAEWSGLARPRFDSLESHLGRHRQAAAAGAVGAGSVAPRASEAGATPSRVATPAQGTTAAAASEAEADRYLIDEWRRSELNIADSLHHAVLVRISRIFDSAQRAGLSQDDRLRIEREVDGINSVNQLTWIERRVAVFRQADSAMRAVPEAP